MKEHLVDIKGDKLFPFHFRVLGVGFVFLGVVAIIENPWIAPIPLLLGLSMISAHEGVVLDKNQNRFRCYSSWLGIKKGKWMKLGNVEKLYVNSSKSSQFIYMRVTTGSTVRYDFYKAFLKFDTGEKVYLTSHKDKSKLIKKLQAAASLFNLPVQDLSRQGGR